MGSTGYRVAALTRYQSIEMANGYTLEVSNIIYTEASNFEVGDLYMKDMMAYRQRSNSAYGVCSATTTR
jgi:hypothetical protein